VIEPKFINYKCFHMRSLSPIWSAQALFRSNVDVFVPHPQHVNLSIVKCGRALFREGWVTRSRAITIDFAEEVVGSGGGASANAMRRSRKIRNTPSAKLTRTNCPGRPMRPNESREGSGGGSGSVGKEGCAGGMWRRVEVRLGT